MSRKYCKYVYETEKRKYFENERTFAWDRNLCTDGLCSETGELIQKLKRTFSSLSIRCTMKRLDVSESLRFKIYFKVHC